MVLALAVHILVGSVQSPQVSGAPPAVVFDEVNRWWRKSQEEGKVAFADSWADLLKSIETEREKVA